MNEQCKKPLGWLFFSIPGVAFPFHYYYSIPHTTITRTQGWLLSNDRACLAPRLDRFQALPRRRRVGGAILTCMLYFLLVRRLIVHSEQVNVYLFWTIAAQCDRPLCFGGLAASRVAPHAA